MCTGTLQRTEGGVRVMLVSWEDVVLFRRRKTYKSAHLQDGYSYYKRLAKDAFK